MAIAILMSVAAFGQGKKTIKEKGITSITVQEYFIDEGMRRPVVESVETYNKNGDLIEIKEFSKREEIQKWEKYVYDSQGNLVEEIFLDERGDVERREKNVYKDGLRVEKQYFDDRDRLTKRKVYEYEYSR